MLYEVITIVIPGISSSNTARCASMISSALRRRSEAAGVVDAPDYIRVSSVDDEQHDGRIIHDDGRDVKDDSGRGGMAA